YDANDGIDENSSFMSRLLWRFGGLRDETRRLRIETEYTRNLAEGNLAPAPEAPAAATPVQGQGQPQAVPAIDADRKLAEANAAFRAAMQMTGDRALVVERLDKVMQAYGQVLRADPRRRDASYNYESAARYRASIEEGKG